jgi:hypothetical protein
MGKKSWILALSAGLGILAYNKNKERIDAFLTEWRSEHAEQLEHHSRSPREAKTAQG